MKEIILLALVIVPVYPVFTMADALVFNSIEFWTGDDPIKTAEYGSAPDGIRANVVRSADGRVSLIE